MITQTKTYDLVDADGKPIIVGADLSDLLADAAGRGLTHFSLSRMHDRAGSWQASTRWTWSDGYRVAIEPSAEEAAAIALSMQPVSDQRGRVPAPIPVVEDAGVFG